MAFTYKIIYTPGTKLVLADALSRSPVLLDKLRHESLEDALWEISSIESLPISASRLSRLRVALVADSNGMLLSKYVLEGWPNKREFSRELQPFTMFENFLPLWMGLYFIMIELSSQQWRGV